MLLAEPAIECEVCLHHVASAGCPKLQPALFRIRAIDVDAVSVADHETADGLLDILIEEEAHPDINRIAALDQFDWLVVRVKQLGIDHLSIAVAMAVLILQCSMPDSRRFRASSGCAPTLVSSFVLHPRALPVLCLARY